jgi:hypothetical protein
VPPEISSLISAIATLADSLKEQVGVPNNFSVDQDLRYTGDKTRVRSNINLPVELGQVDEGDESWNTIAKIFAKAQPVSPVSPEPLAATEPVSPALSEKETIKEFSSLQEKETIKEFSSLEEKETISKIVNVEKISSPILDTSSIDTNLEKMVSSLSAPAASPALIDIGPIVEITKAGLISNENIAAQGIIEPKQSLPNLQSSIEATAPVPANIYEPIIEPNINIENQPVSTPNILLPPAAPLPEINNAISPILSPIITPPEINNAISPILSPIITPPEVNNTISPILSPPSVDILNTAPELNVDTISDNITKALALSEINVSAISDNISRSLMLPEINVDTISDNISRSLMLPEINVDTISDNISRSLKLPEISISAISDNIAKEPNNIEPNFDISGIASPDLSKLDFSPISKSISSIDIPAEASLSENLPPEVNLSPIFNIPKSVPSLLPQNIQQESLEVNPAYYSENSINRIATEFAQMVPSPSQGIVQIPPITPIPELPTPKLDVKIPQQESPYDRANFEQLKIQTQLLTRIADKDGRPSQQIINPPSSPSSSSGGGSALPSSSLYTPPKFNLLSMDNVGEII